MLLPLLPNETKPVKPGTASQNAGLGRVRLEQLDPPPAPPRKPGGSLKSLGGLEESSARGCGWSPCEPQPSCQSRRPRGDTRHAAYTRPLSAHKRAFCKVTQRLKLPRHQLPLLCNAGERGAGSAPRGAPRLFVQKPEDEFTQGAPAPNPRIGGRTAATAGVQDKGRGRVGRGSQGLAGRPVRALDAGSSGAPRRARLPGSLTLGQARPRSGGGDDTDPHGCTVRRVAPGVAATPASTRPGLWRPPPPRRKCPTPRRALDHTRPP